MTKTLDPEVPIEVSGTAPTKSDDLLKKDEATHQPQPRQRWAVFTKATMVRSLACITVAIFPVFLVAWLPTYVDGSDTHRLFEGAAVGGSLTLNQAKAIDFVSSVVFAPLVLTAMNYIWFANARTSLN